MGLIKILCFYSPFSERDVRSKYVCLCTDLCTVNIFVTVLVSSGVPRFLTPEASSNSGHP
jgi:hypothetical protein